jgi:hypothetical protein
MRSQEHTNDSNTTIKMATNNDDAGALTMIVSPIQMLRRGLRLLGIDRRIQDRRGKKANVTNFKSHYGIHPNQASTVWKEIIDNEYLGEEEANLKSFFMALNFLRCYDTEDVRATRFREDKRAMRAHTWSWIQKISNLKASKIKFPAPDSWNGTTFICSVDGTHFRLNEPRHATLKKDPTWFSHKHDCAGHNVQVVMSVWESKCYDITISKGGTNDKGNVIKSGLLDKIPAGKRAIVDGGYPGDMAKLSGYNQFDSDELKKFKARVKSRHETFNARLKIFNVLGQRFIHDKEQFPLCLEAVAVLVQYSIEDVDPESGNPLSDV